MCAAISLRVDPWKAAAQGARLEGCVPGTMPRLEREVRALLEAPWVALDFQVESAAGLGADSGAGPGSSPVSVHGTVGFRARMQCQCCLEDFDYLHRGEVRIQVSKHPEVEGVDDVVACDADGKLDVAALVEDEILLGLPLSARCGGERCLRGLAEGLEWRERAAGETEGGADSRSERENPFAVLASLMSSGDDLGQGMEGGHKPEERDSRDSRRDTRGDPAGQDENE